MSFANAAVQSPEPDTTTSGTSGGNLGAGIVNPGSPPTYSTLLIGAQTMIFDEVQLDPGISYGASGGPYYVTLVIKTPSQAETRVVQSPRAFRKWKVDLSTKSRLNMITLQQFFILRMAKARGFRFKDWTDYKVALEPLVYTSGLTLQLTKTYTDPFRTEVRPIRKPVIGSVVLYRDGSATPWTATSNWAIDTTTGIITFAASQVGHTFKWSGNFDTPARFDFDEMQIVYTDFDILDWKSINILEIPV